MGRTRDERKSGGEYNPEGDFVIRPIRRVGIHPGLYSGEAPYVAQRELKLKLAYITWEREKETRRRQTCEE